MKILTWGFLLGALALPVQAQETGEALFTENCAACHQAQGVGAPGLAPPLKHPAFYEALGEEAGPYLARVLLHGLTGRISSQGEVYVGVAMPAQAWMSDADLALIANYILVDLNGLAPSLDADHLAALRDAPLPNAQLLEMRAAAAP